MAEVSFTAPSGWRVEKIAVDARRKFDWLAERKSADGLLLVRPPDGGWEAHIIECKRTIRSEATWTKVQAQLRGSRVRLDAIIGVVGLEIERVVLYSGFREDLIGFRSPDPIVGVPLVGAPMDSDSIPVQRARWGAPRLPVRGFGSLPHRRVQLVDQGDDVGRASIDLARRPA